MKCPACGTRNNYYHRYCYYCGEKLGAMIDPLDQEAGRNYRNDGSDSFPTVDKQPSYYGDASFSYEEIQQQIRDTAAETFSEQQTDPGKTAGDQDEFEFFGEPDVRPQMPPETPPDFDEGKASGAASAAYGQYGRYTPAQERDRPGTLRGEYGRTSGIHSTAEDAISQAQRDIAAKISSMEKYMDEYLAGRIGPAEEAADTAPFFNDSLDFIRTENEPTPPAERAPRQGTPVHPLRDQEIDDPFEDEETSKMIDMLYQDQMRDSGYPRRSRRRDEPEEADDDPDSNAGNVIVKVMVSLVIIALIGFASFVLWNEFLNPNRVRPVSTADPVVTHTVEPDTGENGEPGQRMTLYISHGVSATIYGTTYPVENNRVQVFFTDAFLEEQYAAAGDTVKDRILPVIATIYGENDKTITHTVNIELSAPAVSLAVFKPEGDTVEVAGDTCTLEISVQPGARLFINDIEYTDHVGADGLAVIEMGLQGSEEMLITIRASLEGYRDAQKQITVVRSQGQSESLLVVNGDIPIKTTAREVTLTGHVPPGATIRSSLPVVGTISIDDAGAFSLTVQIPSRPGYSVCLLEVLLDGIRVDQQEVIIDKQASFNEYTTGPWEFSPYADYKANPDLHAGYRFTIPGTVKDVVSQSDGLTVFTLDVNPTGVEQLIRVWYWGDFGFTSGNSIIVYGNRWGNEEGIPRILAKYLVSR